MINISLTNHGVTYVTVAVKVGLHGTFQIQFLVEHAVQQECPYPMSLLG